MSGKPRTLRNQKLVPNWELETAIEFAVNIDGSDASALRRIQNLIRRGTHVTRQGAHRIMSLIEKACGLSDDTRHQTQRKNG